MGERNSESNRTYTFLLAAGFLVAVAVRLAVSLRWPGPAVTPDEPSYLAMARYTSGVGEPYLLGLGPLYAPGYSVLIAPLFWLFDDPVHVYRAIMALNAVLGGVLVVLLEMVARRITNLQRPATIAVATVAACLPALVATSGAAWSDNLAPLVFIALVLAAIRLVERPTPSRAVALVGVETLAFAVHSRFAPLALVIIGLLVLLTMRKRISWPACLGAATALILGLLAVRGFGLVFKNALYEPEAQRDALIKDLYRARFVGPALITGAGQLWYLVVTTVGVVGFGMLAMIRAWFRLARARWRGGSSTDETAPLSTLGLSDSPTPLAIVSVFSFVMFATSVGFLANRPEPDTLVYGRYNEAFIAVLFVVGVATLAAERPMRTRIVDTAVLVVSLFAVVALLQSTRSSLFDTPFSDAMSTGLKVFASDIMDSLGAIAAMGAVLTVALTLITYVVRRHRVAAVLGFVTLLLPYSIAQASDLFLPAEDRASPVQRAEALFSSDDELAVMVNDAFVVRTAWRVPFFYPDVKITPDLAGDSLELRRPLVMANPLLKEASRSGYRIGWLDPNGNVAIWVAPGPRQDELAQLGKLQPKDFLSPSPTDDGVRIIGDLRIEGDRLEGTVTVNRPAGDAWATADGEGGFVKSGRIRLGIRTDEDGCIKCDQAVVRVDLEREIDGTVTRFTIPVSVSLADLPVTGEVKVQLVRAGVNWFGNELTITG